MTSVNFLAVATFASPYVMCADAFQVSLQPERFLAPKCCDQPNSAKATFVVVIISLAVICALFAILQCSDHVRSVAADTFRSGQVAVKLKKCNFREVIVDSLHSARPFSENYGTHPRTFNLDCNGEIILVPDCCQMCNSSTCVNFESEPDEGALRLKKVRFREVPVDSEHSVPPYSEIYGMHPRVFNFDCNGEIIHVPECCQMCKSSTCAKCESEPDERALRQCESGAKERALSLHVVADLDLEESWNEIIYSQTFAPGDLEIGIQDDGQITRIPEHLDKDLEVEDFIVAIDGMPFSKSLLLQYMLGDREYMLTFKLQLTFARELELKSARRKSKKMTRAVRLDAPDKASIDNKVFC